MLETSSKINTIIIHFNDGMYNLVTLTLDVLNEWRLDHYIVILMTTKLNSFTHLFSFN